MASQIVGSVSIRVLPYTKDFVPNLKKYLDRIEAQTRLSVTIDADTSGLRREVSEAVREAEAGQKAKVDVEIDRAKLRQLATDAAAAGSVLRRLVTAPIKISVGIAGINAVVAGAAQAAVALKDLAGAAALLPSIGAAAGASLLTLIVGFKGIGGALKAYSDGNDKAASSGANLAQQQIQTARSIRDAQQGIGDALKGVARAREAAAESAVSADRRIEDAEQSLADAQRDSVQAQQSLTRARLDAQKAVRDLALDVQQGALQQQQAELDLADARDDYERSQLTRQPERIQQQYLVRLQEQEVALAQLKNRNSDLQQQQAQTARTGIDGTDGVTAAQQRLIDANRKVGDAQQGVADAVADAKKAQIDGAQQIADAQDQVARAQQRLADVLQDAMQKAGDSAAGGVDKIGEALSKISPNARAVVTAIQSLKPAFTGVKFAVQDALFDGVAPVLISLAQVYIPVLRNGLAGVANAFNVMFMQIAGFARNAQTVRDTGVVFDNTSASVRILGGAVRDLLYAFRDIGTVGSVFLPGIAQGAANAAAHFRDFVASARESGKLAQFIGGGIQAMRDLGAIVKNVGSILGSVFSAFNVNGTSLFTTLRNITGQFAAFLQTAQGQQILQNLAQIFSLISQVVSTVFITALKAIAPILVELQPFFVQLVQTIGKDLIDAINYLAPRLRDLAHYMSDNKDTIVPLVEALGGFALVVGPVVGALTTLKRGIEAAKIAWELFKLAFIDNPFGLIIAAIVGLAYLIYKNWDQIKATTIAVWTFIKNTVVNSCLGIKYLTQAIFNGIASFFGDIWRNITGTFSSAVGAIGRFFNNLGSNVSSVLRSIGNSVYNIGHDIVYGIWDGIAGTAHWLWDRLNELADGIWRTIKNSLGIASPSKVMRDEIGHWIPAGIASGIDANSDVVTDSMNRVAGLVRDAGMSATASVQTSVTASGAYGDAISSAVATGFSRVRIDMDGRQVAKGVNEVNKGSRGR